MQHSTHIRFLAFSLSPILSEHISIHINGAQLSGHIERPTLTVSSNDFSPLFTMPWNPSLYNNGLNTISITITDQGGRTTTHSQLFSLDGTIAPLAWFSDFILSLRWSVYLTLGARAGACFVVFGLLIGIKVWVVVYLQRAPGACDDRDDNSPHTHTTTLFNVWFAATLHMLDQEDKNEHTRKRSVSVSLSSREIVSRWFSLRSLWHWMQRRMQSYIFRFVVMCEYDPVTFYTLVVYGLYLLTGPLFFGHVFANELGFFCSWGLVTWSGDVYPNNDFDFLFMGVMMLYWSIVHTLSHHSFFYHAQHASLMHVHSSSTKEHHVVPCCHHALWSGRVIGLYMLIGVWQTFMCAFTRVGYSITSVVLSPGVLWLSCVGFGLWLRLVAKELRVLQQRSRSNRSLVATACMSLLRCCN